MRLMIDLFSGLGGASEAFIHSPKWIVKRFEVNPLLKNVPCTRVQDIRNIDIDRLQGAELIWASFPCTDFSRAVGAPGPVAERAGRQFEPSLELAELTKKIIDEVNPKHWIVENVAGAVPHLQPIFGRPHQVLGPFNLWGNFPKLTMPNCWEHIKPGFPGSKLADTWSTDPLRANKRALIPLELSQALLTALDEQTTINDWV
jgi:hypothetical protein